MILHSCNLYVATLTTSSSQITKSNSKALTCKTSTSFIGLSLPSVMIYSRICLSTFTHQSHKITAKKVILMRSSSANIACRVSKIVLKARITHFMIWITLRHIRSRRTSTTSKPRSYPSQKTAIAIIQEIK